MICYLWILYHFLSFVCYLCIYIYRWCQISSKKKRKKRRSRKETMHFSCRLCIVESKMGKRQKDRRYIIINIFVFFTCRQSWRPVYHPTSSNMSAHNIPTNYKATSHAPTLNYADTAAPSESRFDTAYLTSIRAILKYACLVSERYILEELYCLLFFVLVALFYFTHLCGNNTTLFWRICISCCCCSTCYDISSSVYSYFWLST